MVNGNSEAGFCRDYLDNVYELVLMRLSGAHDGHIYIYIYTNLIYT